MQGQLYRDSVGVVIDAGSIIKHGKKRGIVLDDEFEGLYAVLESGTKLRIKDYCKRVTVVAKRKGNPNGNRK